MTDATSTTGLATSSTVPTTSYQVLAPSEVSVNRVESVLTFLAALKKDGGQGRPHTRDEVTALQNGLIGPLTSAVKAAKENTMSRIPLQTIMSVYDTARASAEQDGGWACPSGVAKKFLYSSRAYEDTAFWRGGQQHMLWIDKKYNSLLSDADMSLSPEDVVMLQMSAPRL